MLQTNQVALAAMTLCLALPLQADILNPSFGDDLDGWSSEGKVDVTTNQVGNRAVMLREPGSGGLSRFWQIFDRPDPELIIGFSYAFVSGPGREELSLPPDSFTVRLVNESTGASFGGSVAVSLGGFLYIDTDLHLDLDQDAAYDNELVTVDEPGDDGMRQVTLDLSQLPNQGWQPEHQVRLEFGLAGVDNDTTSYAIIGGIYLCADEDETPPTMDCPPQFIVADDPYDFGETGEPTNLQDDCDPNPVLDHLDEVNLGCPTVVTRTWIARDAAGNESVCVQSITDLNPESEFYTCLIDWFGPCLEQTCNPALSVDDRISVYQGQLPGCVAGNGIACTCTLAERLTECFKDIHSPGGVQSCSVHLAQDLRNEGLICQGDVGNIANCMSKRHQALYKSIVDLGFTTCRGGPYGTELCNDVDTCNYGDPEPGHCCYKPDGDGVGYCGYTPEQCNPE